MGLWRITRFCRRCQRPSLLLTADPQPKAWPCRFCGGPVEVRRLP